MIRIQVTLINSILITAVILNLIFEEFLMTSLIRNLSFFSIVLFVSACGGGSSAGATIEAATATATATLN